MLVGGRERGNLGFVAAGLKSQNDPEKRRECLARGRDVALSVISGLLSLWARGCFDFRREPIEVCYGHFGENPFVAGTAYTINPERPDHWNRVDNNEASKSCYDIAYTGKV